MNNQDIQTKIDNYLLNRMTEAERQDFETGMAADSKLKESVDLQRLLVSEIQQRVFISEIIVETKERMKKTKEPHVTFRKIMMLTWSAAAIFIGVFFVNSAVQNSRMDNLYTENYSAPQVNAMRGDGMRGTDSNETDFWQAIKLLENKQPKQALEILQKLYKITDIFIYYEDVRWYLALTELKLHNKSEAKKYLNELVNSEFYAEKVKKVLEKL